jgi:molybdopterin converting factor small subunit
MKVVVHLAAALRQHAAGSAHVDVDVNDPATIGAVIAAVAAEYPAIGRRLQDEAGVLRRHVNVFVGPDNLRDLDGLDSDVPEGVEVSILPAISGG